MADTDDDAPSFLAKQRAARPWLDHLVRAAGRFQEQKGDYYAAGITYFSVLALIPIMMVAFAVAGFVLAGHPEYLESIQEQITKSIPGSLGDTINTLIDSAIDGADRAAQFVTGRGLQEGTHLAPTQRRVGGDRVSQGPGQCLGVQRQGLVAIANQRGHGLGSQVMGRWLHTVPRIQLSCRWWRLPLHELARALPVVPPGSTRARWPFASRSRVAKDRVDCNHRCTHPGHPSH